MKPILKLLWVAANQPDAESGVKSLEDYFLVEWDLAIDLKSFQQLLTEKEYDIIVSSCHQSDFSCLEVFDQLQKAEKNIPFIVLGEMEQWHLANECLRRGMCDFIFKEHIQALSISILRLIRQAELRVQAESENQKLREEVRQAGEWALLLGSMAQDLRFEQAADRLVGQLGEWFGADCTSLFLLQQEEWRLRASRGWTAGCLPESSLADPEVSWVHRIFEDGVKVWKEPRTDWPCLTGVLEISSWASVPLESSGLKGLILIASCQPDGFEAGQQGRLEEISRQTSPMLGTLRLLEILSLGKAEWEKSLDALDDYIAIYDAEGTIRRVNHPLQEHLGLPYAGILGKKAPQVFNHSSLRLDFFPAQDLKEALPLSREISDPEREQTFLVNCVPILGSSGAFTGMIQVAKNITQEKRLHEYLIQRETLSALGELVAGISHELNNPLTGIIGYSQLLLTREDLDPAIRGALEKVAKEGARAGKIVQSLLTFARKQPSAKVMTDLPDMVEEVLDLFGYELKHASVNVIKQYEEGLQPIWVDPGQIQQVLVNLVNNALHAMVKTGRTPELKITLRQSSDWLYLHLRDNGCGIHKKNLSKIFDPFFTTKPIGKGTGLGLSISFGILVSHKGEISVQSEEGHWTEFTLRFPLQPDFTTELAPLSTMVKGELQPKKVLIVDDDPIILNLIRQILAYEGHFVETAADGRSGMDYLRRGPFDVAIFETNLPDYQIEPLYLQLKTDFPWVVPRLLFLTSELINPEVRIFLDQIEVHWLAKPFSIPELARAIREVVVSQ
jgi:signal transduction histidine kinase/DNA-binding response OmpR family regulator